MTNMTEQDTEQFTAGVQLHEAVHQMTARIQALRDELTQQQAIQADAEQAALKLTPTVKQTKYAYQEALRLRRQQHYRTDNAVDRQREINKELAQLEKLGFSSE